MTAAVALKERLAVQVAAEVRKQKRAFPAKPAKGEIDYKALRRTVMNRYPKTLAHLAK